MWQPRTLLLTLVVGLAAAESPPAQHPVAKKWALLVAGSKDYYNYRHQVTCLDLISVLNVDLKLICCRLTFATLIKF